ncbi:uncharacterized protein LOC131882271 [Tigriopus californicus]|nr:uncharacterized protein LOC131882271 [Tigriopus californicus]
MVKKFTSLLGLCGISVVVCAQENYHEYQANNPWANYERLAEKQTLSPRNQFVDRQGFFATPEATAIAAAALGGVVGLVGIGLSLAEANTQRQNIAQNLGATTSGQLGSCERDRDIINKMNEYSRVITLLIQNTGRRSESRVLLDAESRQNPEQIQFLQSVAAPIAVPNCG